MQIAHAYTGVEQTLEGEAHVVAALGWTVDDDVYRAVRAINSNVRRAGDCVAPREVGLALYSAEQLARSL